MREFSLIGALTFAAAGLLLTGCPDVTPDDPFATLGTTTANNDDTNDDGDTMGTEDEVGTDDTTTSDSTDTTTDEGCPPGTFGCPCDNGMCGEGLECDDDNMCGLPSGTDTTTTTTGPDLGMCDPSDTYCLANGCPDTAGQGLVLDTNMDGVNDWGWCLHECTMDGDCPAYLGGATVACTMWSMEGDMACFLNCDVNDPSSCASGSECSTIAGPPLCLYDASGF